MKMDYKLKSAAFLIALFMTANLTLALEKDDDNDQDSSLIVVNTEDEQNNTRVSIQYVDKVDGYDPDMEPFEPTEEWQTIKPGQSIPRGLHVRMNLQTGSKEAKLMDEDERTTEDEPEGSKDKEEILASDPGRLQRMKEAIEKAINDLDEEKKQGLSQEDMKYWKDGSKEGIVNTKKDSFTADELKKALKKFKASRDDVQDPKNEDTLTKFRSMDELKEDLKKLEVNMKTDLEILTDLLSQYRKRNLPTTEHVNLLSDLEYYLHQIDNADNFVDMGGLDLLKHDLNSTEESIREEAISVFGSAAQNNPKVQVKVLDAGVLQLLIHMLSTETSLQIQSRLLYSLSCLIRHFPYAQQRFLQLGGLQAMANFFTKPETEKLRIKAITLVNDLFLERKLTAEYGNADDSSVKEKLKLYNRIPLPEAIHEQGWCGLMVSLLDMPDHDTREKVFNAMETFIDVCPTDFTKSRPVLQKLRKEYVSLAEEEKSDSSGDTYFTDVLSVLDHLLKKIPHKDEL